MADEEKKKPEKAERKPGAGKPGEKKSRGKGDAPKKEQQQIVVTAEYQVPRFYTRYQAEIVPALMKQFGYKNPMQVPRLKKVVINMGLGASTSNPKIIDAGVEELQMITGQKPIVTRSKKAIANFKLRAGLPIGAMMTLRRAKM